MSKDHLTAEEAANRIRGRFNAQALPPEFHHRQGYLTSVAGTLGVDATPANLQAISDLLEDEGVEFPDHEYPKWIEPHESHVHWTGEGPGRSASVSGFSQHHVGRDGKVGVLVNDEDEEKRALAQRNEDDERRAADDLRNGGAAESGTYVDPTSATKHPDAWPVQFTADNKNLVPGAAAATATTTDGPQSGDNAGLGDPVGEADAAGERKNADWNDRIRDTDVKAKQRAVDADDNGGRPTGPDAIEATERPEGEAERASEEV